MVATNLALFNHWVTLIGPKEQITITGRVQHWNDFTSFGYYFLLET